MLLVVTSRILNKPVVPQQPSVNTTAAGTAALAYNSTNGEFTFTPPDLSLVCYCKVG